MTSSPLHWTLHVRSVEDRARDPLKARERGCPLHSVTGGGVGGDISLVLAFQYQFHRLCLGHVLGQHHNSSSKLQGEHVHNWHTLTWTKDTGGKDAEGNST